MSSPAAPPPPPTPSVWTTLARFTRRYVLRYWVWFAAGLLFLLGTSWLAVQIPLELARGIDALRQTGDLDAVRRSAVTIAWMGVVLIVVRTLSRVLFFTPGRLLEYRLRTDLFAHVITLQPSFFASHSPGDIINRASSDLQFVRAMVGFGILQVFNVVATVALTGQEMFRISPSLTALSLAPVLLSLIVVQAGINRFFTLSNQAQQQLGRVSEHLLASLQGVRTIQGFNAEGAFLERLRERDLLYTETNLKMAWVRTIVMPLLPIATTVSVYLLIAVGGPMAVAGQLSVGQIVAFVAYIGSLLFPLRGLGFMVTVFQRGFNSLERIDELLYAVAEQPEGPSPAAPPARLAAIELHDLKFAYPDAPEKAVLRGLTVNLPAGKILGVYGATGSGKSTLLRLLTRQRNPEPGQILLRGEDGQAVDLTAISLNEWRRRLAVVPQVPFLFSESIEQNIAMGEPDPARLTRAVRRAALEADLGALPEGLKTTVGERGIMLSGGQRQRAALARGLYRDFDLLVLDDVLSAVDQKTEQQLIQTLLELTAPGPDGRRPTVILVSHRLSALARADKVIVLREGGMADFGSHEELLRRCAVYQEAWSQQQEQAAAEPAAAEVAS
ncbi:ABC transporter ATP-binding protein/permease [Myxococcota bacterium]|nr:ABC transporter ATP-binding protein/permease [Myxococcota bacterium]